MEALDLARWDDLPDARLDWERVTELAATQEISEADVVWDLAGASLAPQRKPSKKTGKRAASSQKRPPARRRSA